MIKAELNEVEDKTRQKFAAQLDDLQREIRLRDEEISSKDHEIQLMNQRVADARREVDTTESKLETMQRELFDVKSDKEYLQEEVERLRRQPQLDIANLMGDGERGYADTYDKITKELSALK